MKNRLILTLGMALAVGCTPAVDDSGDSTPTGGKATGGTATGGSATGGSATGGSTTGGSTTGGTPGTTGGSGGSTTGGSTTGGANTGGAGNATGGATGDAKPAGDAPPASGGSVAGALDNQVFTVNCPAGGTGTSCTISDANARKIDKTFTLGGDAATTYMVKLKFCGVFESRPYNTCMAQTGADKRLCVGGTPASTPSNAPTYPTLGVKVTEPAQTYFVNSAWEADTVSQINFSWTIPMKGGTTVQVLSDGGSNGGVYTGRLKAAYTCPDVPGVTTPFNGQFLHVKVESVTPM